MAKNGFNEVKQKYQQLKSNLTKEVGELAASHFKENFRKQAFDGEKWKPRSKADKNSKKRNLLVKSGRLRRSIRRLRTTARSVTVGSLLPYADIHNEGGQINQNPSEQQRKFFWAKFKETKNELWKRLATTKEIKIKIPKRQFIGYSRELNSKIDDFIKKRLKSIFQ